LPHSNGGLRNLAPLAWRKDNNCPVSQAESGFDLTHVEPGIVSNLMLRHRRCPQVTLRARFLSRVYFLNIGSLVPPPSE